MPILSSSSIQLPCQLCVGLVSGHIFEIRAIHSEWREPSSHTRNETRECSSLLLLFSAAANVPETERSIIVVRKLRNGQ